MVYDASISLPGCGWTALHTRQGFARRGSTVNFRTLLEFGDARVSVYSGPYAPEGYYDRVVAVRFHSVRGQVLIEGPEDPGDEERAVNVDPRFYELVAAQQVLGEERERIDLFFDRRTEPVLQSRILVADSELDPHRPCSKTPKSRESADEARSLNSTPDRPQSPTSLGGRSRASRAMS
jgi:hypothetical protein